MTPDCNEVLEQVYLLLDGELDEDSCQALKLHLQLCSACFGRVETERLFKEVLKEKCGCEPAPPGLITRIQFSLRVEAGTIE